MRTAMPSEFQFHIQATWKGKGTEDVKAYSRDLVIQAEGKPDLSGTADPAFMGDKAKWSPEDLLVAAISSCHMLSFLYLASMAKISVLSYVDKAEGKMELKGAVGHFTKVTLKPEVTISDPSRQSELKELHAKAHHNCFIANSVNFPVEVV